MNIQRCLKCGKMLKRSKNSGLCRVCYSKVWKKENYIKNKPKEKFVKIDGNLYKRKQCLNTSVGITFNGIIRCT